MKKLEIIISTERSNRTHALLCEMFPTIKQETRSSFFVILGCYIPQLTQDEKQWLDAMVNKGTVVRYRCKEREDR